MEVDTNDLLRELGALYLRNQMLARDNAALRVSLRRAEAAAASNETDAAPAEEAPTE
jgi:hypothetical protein